MLLALGGGCGEDDTNEEPLSLPAVGAIGDWCSNAATISVAFTIGVEGECGGSFPEGQFVTYATYGNDTGALKAGQAWQSGKDAPLEEVLHVRWFPEGAVGDEVLVDGALEVLSLTDDEAELRYEFVTREGQPYEGVAKVFICAAEPSC